MEYSELKRLMSEQKDEMTAAERMKAYNAREEVDYTPVIPCEAPDPHGRHLRFHYDPVCQRF